MISCAADQELYRNAHPRHLLRLLRPSSPPQIPRHIGENAARDSFHDTSSRRRWPAHTPRERTDLKLSTVSDGDLLGGLARLAAVALDRLHDLHALHNLSEDHMALVQPGRLHGADEELRAVGVGSGVGHAQDSGSGVLQREVLILELVAVDGLSASAVVVGEVATCGLEDFINVGKYHLLVKRQEKEFVYPMAAWQSSHLPWHMKLGITRWKLDPL